MTHQANRFLGPVVVLVFLGLLLQLYWMQRNWGQVTRRTDHQPLDAELLNKLTSRMINLYECEYCQGNGLLDDPEHPGERKLCLICWGVGYHATRRLTDAERMCLSCGGMGRHYDAEGSIASCPRCSGRGLVEMEHVEEPGEEAPPVAVSPPAL